MTKSPQDGADEFLIGTPSELLQRAAAHYNAAEFAAAMAICEEIVASAPDNAEALHILGHIAAQTRAWDIALGYFVRAVSAAPTDTRFNRSFAVALETSGRIDQAIQAWTQYLALEPDSADAFVHLARLHAGALRYKDAVNAYTKAFALAPSDRDIGFALAVVQHKAGQLNDAIETYTALRRVDANWAAVRNNLGLVLIDAKRLDEASVYLEEALHLQPDDAEIQNNLGVCLARRGERTAARNHFDNALALRPGWPEGLLNLANIQRQEDQLEEAVENYRKAIEGNPSDYRSYGNLALAQVNLNAPDDAIESYEKALELAPNDPELRKGLGIAQLLKGDLHKGWQNYEARLQCDDQREFASLRWNGDNLAGRSILVHAEQGFGDTLQFCRYLTQVAKTANAGEVVFECQRPLYRLLATIDGADTVIARGDPLPNTDFHVPLLSLPRIFDTTLDNIPAPSPYLSTPAETSATLSARKDDSVRIGVVWKGNPNRQDDEKRSCRLADLRPLSDIPKIQLLSLQTDATDQERQWLAEQEIEDLAAGFSDFADTAAHISALELIVSVDTAAAHLAGALGKPIWVLLGESADWRYLIGRDDCPWYPTMRLFRQQNRGDWHGTAQRLGQALIKALNL